MAFFLLATAGWRGPSSTPRLSGIGRGVALMIGFFGGLRGTDGSTSVFRRTAAAGFEARPARRPACSRSWEDLAGFGVPAAPRGANAHPVQSLKRSGTVRSVDRPGRRGEGRWGSAYRNTPGETPQRSVREKTRAKYRSTNMSGVFGRRECPPSSEYMPALAGCNSARPILRAASIHDVVPELKHQRSCASRPRGSRSVHERPLGRPSRI